MVESTKHAREMLKERGFTRGTVFDAILNPDRMEGQSGEEWHALKRIGDKVLRVVGTELLNIRQRFKLKDLTQISVEMPIAQ